jgi:hypothetical protein
LIIPGTNRYAVEGIFVYTRENRKYFGTETYFGKTDIIKVGTAVDHDIKNLLKIENFNVQDFYDLGMFSKQLKIVHIGLRNLGAIFLRIRISKVPIDQLDTGDADTTANLK